MFETNKKKLKRNKIRNSEIDSDIDTSSKKEKHEVVCEKSFDVTKKKIGTRRLRVVSKKEQENDKAIENESNFSVTMMIVILIICFGVGIALGYVMYRLAIDTSAIIVMGKNILFNIVCLKSII